MSVAPKPAAKKPAPIMSFTAFMRAENDARMKARIATMKSSIDNAAPSTFSATRHVTANAKKEADNRARAEVIDAENTRLLKQLHSIHAAHDPMRIHTNGSRPLPSLNLPHRKRELERIATENAFLLRKIKENEKKGSMPGHTRGGTLKKSATQPVLKSAPLSSEAPPPPKVAGGAGAMAPSSNNEPDIKPAEPETVPAAADTGYEEAWEADDDEKPKKPLVVSASSPGLHTASSPPAPTPDPMTSKSKLRKPIIRKEEAPYVMSRASLRIYQTSTISDLSCVYAQYEQKYLRTPKPSDQLAAGTLQILQDKDFASTGVLAESNVSTTDAQIVASLAEKGLVASASAPSLTSHSVKPHHKVALSPLPSKKDGESGGHSPDKTGHPMQSPMKSNLGPTPSKAAPSSGAKHGTGALAPLPHTASFFPKNSPFSSPSKLADRTGTGTGAGTSTSTGAGSGATTNGTAQLSASGSPSTKPTPSKAATTDAISTPAAAPTSGAASQEGDEAAAATAGTASAPSAPSSPPPSSRTLGTPSKGDSHDPTNVSTAPTQVGGQGPSVGQAPAGAQVPLTPSKLSAEPTASPATPSTTAAPLP